MKMVSAGAGLGVDVKDFRVIFVFESDKAFKQFLDSGWSGSAQGDAAAKAGTLEGRSLERSKLLRTYTSTRSPKSAWRCNLHCRALSTTRTTT